MTNTNGKKVSLLLPPEVLKVAKLKAAQHEKTLEDWILSLIQEQVQDTKSVTMTALDWGRVDSRIDQGISSLERRVEVLADKVEFLLREHLTSQLPNRGYLESESSLNRELTHLSNPS